MSVGVWRVFMLPSNFVERACPSAQPLSGRWHVSQDIFAVFESRVSKNNFFPSSTFSGVMGLSAGTAISPSGPTSGLAAGAGVAGAAGFEAGCSELLAHEAANTSNASAQIFAVLMEADVSAPFTHGARTIFAH